MTLVKSLHGINLFYKFWALERNTFTINIMYTKNYTHRVQGARMYHCTHIVEECSIKRERSGWFCVLRCKRARNLRGKNRLLSPQPQVCIQLKNPVVPASLLRKEIGKVHSWLHCYLKGMCVMPDVLYVYSYEFRIREGRGEGGWVGIVGTGDSRYLLHELRVRICYERFEWTSHSTPPSILPTLYSSTGKKAVYSM